MIVYIIQGVFILEFLIIFIILPQHYCFFLNVVVMYPKNINSFNYRGTFFKLTRSFSQHTVYMYVTVPSIHFFSVFWGTYFQTPLILCNIKFKFARNVPRHFIFHFFGVRVSNLCFILYHILYCNIKM